MVSLSNIPQTYGVIDFKLVLIVIFWIHTFTWLNGCWFVAILFLLTIVSWLIWLCLYLSGFVYINDNINFGNMVALWLLLPLISITCLYHLQVVPLVYTNVLFHCFLFCFDLWKNIRLIWNPPKCVFSCCFTITSELGLCLWTVKPQ